MDHPTSTITSPPAVETRTATTLRGRRRSWQRRYAALVICVDALIVAVTVFGTQVVWLGPHPQDVSSAPVTYTTVSAVLGATWLAALSLFGTRAPRVIGYGVVEYRLVVAASAQLFGIVAIVAYLGGVELSRGYFLLSLPAGTVLLLLGRLSCRAWLTSRRRRGAMSARVVLVGGAAENARVAADVAREADAGLHVVGMHTLGPDIDATGWTEDDARRLQERLTALDADTVLVTGGPGLTAHEIRRIGWSLEPGSHHLVVAVNLTDVAGPRIHTRPVSGLPLVHVETPRYSVAQRVLKRGFDIVVSAALLLVLSPALAVLSLLVRASGPGPVLYRQERIGHGGRPFGMMKFRSMVDGADARLGELLAAQGRDGSPLFKVDDDPRVTPLGRVLRKYSLDELPQLFNVLGGSMSLVGPRPQREAEVAFYDDDARRRLIVRPGMSGLWQVSGRSALTWEDAIRLDLFYVENWSLMGDVLILLRTFKAVFAPGSTAH